MNTVTVHVNSLNGSLVRSCKMSLYLWEIVFCIKILPIILAICLMLLPSYYAQNYAGIIGSSLMMGNHNYEFSEITYT